MNNEKLNAEMYKKQVEYSHKDKSNFAHYGNLVLRGGLTLEKSFGEVAVANIEDPTAKMAMRVIVKLLEASINELKKIDFGEKTFKDIEHDENLHPTLGFVISYAKEQKVWDKISNIKVKDVINQCIKNVLNRAMGRNNDSRQSRQNDGMER